MIKYSVVIPMYNSKDTIIQTIESVYSQTRFDLIDEIIIVDDGSIDNSVTLINDYIELKKCKKIKLIKKENGGAASARNIGIINSKNEFIALLDSDDIWEKDKIEKQNEILENNQEIKALGSNRKGEVIRHGSKYKNDIYKISPFQYCIKNWPCTPSLVFSKKIFEDHQYFDESLTHAEEGIFFLDIAAKTGLFYCVEALVDCGGGKPAFGYSGLSGDIKKMHTGILKVMKIASRKKYISRFELLILCIYEQIKYLRRILVTFFINNKLI